MNWFAWCTCRHIGSFHDGTWKLKPGEGTCYSCKLNGKVCAEFVEKE